MRGAALTAARKIDGWMKTDGAVANVVFCLLCKKHENDEEGMKSYERREGGRCAASKEDR